MSHDVQERKSHESLGNAASALDWLALGYAVSVRWFICIPAMERRPLYGRARRVLKHPMFRRFVARA